MTKPNEPAYPAFDNAKPTDAERIATLEARVRELETELAALKRVAGVTIAYPRMEAVNVLTVDLKGVDVTTWDSKWTEE
jgi:hypothetical protein